MRRAQFCAKSLVTLGVVILLSSSLAAVDNPRGFAGFYEARPTADGRNTVQITLTIRIFNYTGRDVRDGTLELRDSLPPHKIIGSVSQVSVNRRDSFVVTGDFILSRREYLQWQKGQHPAMTLEFQDSEGNPQSQSVELVRGHARIEEQ